MISTTIQNARGTTADNAGFTGLNGEISLDTERKTILLHDGVHAGGVRVQEDINVKAFGAKGNGSADDRDALQAAITYCAARQLRLYLPEGVYMVGLTTWTPDGTLYSLEVPSNLTMVGQSREGTVIKLIDHAIPAGSYHPIFRSGASPITDINLSNFTIDGNNANQPSGDINGGNLILGTAHNVTIENLTSVNANGQGIQVANAQFPTPVGTNIRIHGCVVRACTYVGIQVSEFERVTITENIVEDCGDNGIDLYGEDLFDHTPRVPRGTRFIVADNHVKACSIGIFLETVQKGVTSGNVVDSCVVKGLQINRAHTGPDNLLVQGNVFVNNPTGAYLSGDTGGVSISNNHFFDFSTQGIELAHASYVTIQDNTFRPTGIEVPIILTSGTQVAFVVIVENTVISDGYNVAKLLVLNATTNFAIQKSEFFGMPFTLGPDLKRYNADLTTAAIGTAAIATATGDPLFTGKPKILSGSAGNIGPGTYNISLAGLTAGTITVTAYQSGVGRQCAVYKFIHGTSLVIAACGADAVIGSPPITAFGVSSTNLALTVGWPNTEIKWSILQSES
ncbi:MAG: right-handed parallel beta-helix repeat-containing protein [Verrucomicrobia bacterium]|nr:right-handed parallel beta-helix repeat-containing protein [Verrucomicrobiota bacterium]